MMPNRTATNEPVGQAQHTLWRHTHNTEVLLEQTLVTREPGLRQFPVLRLPGQEVEEVDSEPRQHQHLHVEAVPVGAQVQRDLRRNEHVVNTWSARGQHVTPGVTRRGAQCERHCHQLEVSRLVLPPTF